MNSRRNRVLKQNFTPDFPESTWVSLEMYFYFIYLRFYFFQFQTETDIFNSNDTDDVNEAKLLMSKMTRVLNKLVLNEVRRKLCQRIPEDLKDFLESLLDIRGRVTGPGFSPNTQQGKFLFMYQEDNQPPFDMKKLQETLVTLEGLLLSYQKMSADCQNRASPVKDYIEKHVKMLRTIVSACAAGGCGSVKGGDLKRNAFYNKDDLVERELESVGLGKNRRNFVPDFNLDQLVASKIQKPKRYVQQTQETEKYRRLQEAVDKVREKRENEEKIGELFGSGNAMKREVDKFDVDYEKPVVYSVG